MNGVVADALIGLVIGLHFGRRKGTAWGITFGMLAAGVAAMPLRRSSAVRMPQPSVNVYQI